uniref:Uncharacterized protein n=1 Tax=Globodera pallida TaxID=36090 RepID=A0A183CQ70_GLOPA
MPQNQGMSMPFNMSQEQMFQFPPFLMMQQQHKNPQEFYVGAKHSLVRFILIDVIHGRPYLMALLLRDKLNRIYLAHLNNKNKEELQDAFNDVTRIFLLRGPVDLVDISDEYGDEHGLYQKKLDPGPHNQERQKNHARHRQ